MLKKILLYLIITFLILAGSCPPLPPIGDTSPPCGQKIISLDLLAINCSPVIKVSWESVAESLGVPECQNKDIHYYNIYRAFQIGGGLRDTSSFVLLADHLSNSFYYDNEVRLSPNTTNYYQYSYSIVAVDTTGNLSERFFHIDSIQLVDVVTLDSPVGDVINPRPSFSGEITNSGSGVFASLYVADQNNQVIGQRINFIQNEYLSVSFSNNFSDIQFTFSSADQDSLKPGKYSWWVAVDGGSVKSNESIECREFIIK